MVGLQITYTFADKYGYVDGIKSRLGSYSKMRGGAYSGSTSTGIGSGGGAAAPFAAPTSYGSS